MRKRATTAVLTLFFILAGFPAGLVIYWTWSNLLTIAQQGAIMHLSTKKAAQATLIPPTKTKK